jgi:hypothetical protein
MWLTAKRLACQYWHNAYDTISDIFRHDPMTINPTLERKPIGVMVPCPEEFWGLFQRDATIVQDIKAATGHEMVLETTSMDSPGIRPLYLFGTFFESTRALLMTAEWLKAYQISISYERYQKNCYACGLRDHLVQNCAEAKFTGCYRCGESHFARDCPHTTVKCRKCGGSHLTSICPYGAEAKSSSASRQRSAAMRGDLSDVEPILPILRYFRWLRC